MYGDEKPQIGQLYDDGVVDQQAFKSVEEINEHKKRIASKLNAVADDLRRRAKHHDDSKLRQPELGMLIEMDKEPRYPYDSDKYFEKQNKFYDFFEHHYKMNRHHPEHFEDGINGFDAVDLIEFCADITSYVEKITVSEALDVLEKQRKRFNIGDSLYSIIKNTVLNYFSWLGGEIPPPGIHDDDDDKS